MGDFRNKDGPNREESSASQSKEQPSRVNIIRTCPVDQQKSAQNLWHRDANQCPLAAPFLRHDAKQCSSHDTTDAHQGDNQGDLGSAEDANGTLLGLEEEHVGGYPSDVYSIDEGEQVHWLKK